MRIHRALVLGGVLVALAVASFANGASASTLNISPGGNITSLSNGTLTFNFGTLGNAICNLTMMGTLPTSVIVPTAGSYVGSGNINGSINGGCSGAGTGILLLLPIAVDATIFNTSSFAFKLTAAGILLTFANGQRCLYTGDLIGTSNTGTVSSLNVANASLTFVGSLFPTLCTATSGASVHGTLPITTQTVSIR